ncbi:MAG TPA: ABC transporter permease [Clostridiales bacterium]|nr:ABC transporter permease [Clostridiales bacterium]
MNLFLNFIVAAVFAGTPLLFGTLGEILNEKSGHLNLGVEGMMMMGACGGFMAGYMSDSLLVALAAAFLAGLLGALIYAILTITFMADQNVTGLTLTIFGSGISNFFGEYMLVSSETTSLKLPENITMQLRNMNIAGLSDIPVIGRLLFQYDPFVYLGIATAILCGLYLNRTKTGLNLRAIGENPAAADAAGIKVTKLKYLNVLLGGGICGIGGSYCSLIINGGVWMSNSVNGLGWIAVALVIFASWSPGKAIFGSFIFGAFNVLKYYFPKTIITIPNAIYSMLPFVITALVLVITSIRKSKENSQPASCGVNYYREER